MINELTNNIANARRPAPGIRVFTFILSLVVLFAVHPAHAEKQNKEEKKLIKRVEEFYRLLVNAQWGKVEPFVTPDTREIWISAPKNKLMSFHVENVKMAPDGKQATVSVSVVGTVARLPGASMNQTQNSEWLKDRGKWYIKLKRSPSLLEIFKTIKSPSDIASTQPPLIFDHNPVKIPEDTGGETVVKVSFQSIAGYGIAIQDLGTSCPCLTAEVDRTSMQLGEKGVLTLHYNPAANVPTQRTLSVHATVAPLMYPLQLSVIVGQ